ncbi:MAG: VacJ family lipoprotein [Proteobacteria bacterium]|nr:VacJ family lipoprotein [Pseudomonadota bacterium]
MLAMVCLLASACASTDPQTAAVDEVNDPFEPVNRAVFQFNRGADTLLLKPAATGYVLFVPPEIRTGVGNALDNLKSSAVFANDVFQGSQDRAYTTFVRFLINSSIGVLGIFDVATRWGYEQHDEDFGQTLAVWGVRSGPFLMLPLLGPSSPRDTAGIVVDYFLDPLRYVFHNTEEDYVLDIRTGARIVDSRAAQLGTVEEIERSSLDFYAAVRSLYRQRRATEILNGEAPDPFAVDISESPPEENPKAQ